MKKKSLILGVFAVAALLFTTVGSTMALMKAQTEELTNSFEPGSVITEIMEGEDGFKNPMVINQGENACYVRVSVLISPAKALENVELTGGEGWTLKEDGYYYYNEPLAPGEVTGAVFETIKIKEGVDWSKLGIEDFEVTVYEESVQTTLYVDGNAVTDPAAIWQLYAAEVE